MNKVYVCTYTNMTTEFKAVIVAPNDIQAKKMFKECWEIEIRPVDIKLDVIGASSREPFIVSTEES
jgi:hypothetical protein